MRYFRTALIQFLVHPNKYENFRIVREKAIEAKRSKVDCVALPECFNSPYGINYFRENSEPVPGGESSKFLSMLAFELQVFVIGGTIPERDNDIIYNTCTVWNPNGDMIAKYRKMHLFNINIPGKIGFSESTVMDAGKQLAIFEMFGWKCGLGICYDLRFEELAKLYRKNGCGLLIYPAAFNMTTGPLHFELLQRARALDNQVWVLGISPAKGKYGYIAWGHSQITTPWGKVIAQAKEDEEIIYSDIDPKLLCDVRNSIPIFEQRRTDVYETILTNGQKL